MKLQGSFRRLLIIIMTVSAALITAALILFGSGKSEFIDGPLVVNGDSTLKETSFLPDTLTITSWNLGYSGLGAEGEFKADGGNRIFPVNENFVQKHIDNICSFVANDKSDIRIFQEVAKKSHLIYEHDLYNSLKSVLPSFNNVFSPSVHLKHFPVIGRLYVGNCIFSQYKPASSMRYSLPAGDNFFTRPFTLKYNFIVQHYPITGSDKYWSIIDLHFSAFDKGGKLRQKQFEKLKSVLLDEYNKGNYVVAGGDWNQRLAKTNFSYTTEEKYLFWIHDLPEDATPPGWSWGIDPRFPTVRTLERPFHSGENYTCIIDGFLVSPNVTIESVTTINREFSDSDHNPVKIRIRRK
jgi:endonuclease/exonuclease/phosphatase family metal-dependent hydrolase